MSNRLTRAFAFFLALCAIPASALADGVEIGDFQLGASLGLEAGYNFNVYFEDAADDPQGSAQLGIRPELTLRTMTPRFVDLNAQASLLWSQYLSSDENVRGQSGPELTVGGGARFAPNQTFSLFVNDQYRRGNDPSFLETGEPYNHQSNTLSFGIGYHPGGASQNARLGFSGELAGQYRTWRFDRLSSLDKDSIGANLRLQYNFLPYTAFSIYASAYRTTYDTGTRSLLTDEPLDGGGDVVISNSDSTPIHVMGVFSGLLTRRLTFRLGGGYGTGGYDSGPSVRTYITLAEAGYLLSPSDTLDFGWRHNFEDSTFGNFVTYHRFFTRLSSELQNVTTSLAAHVSLVSHAPVDNPASGGVPVFDDGTNGATVERQSVVAGVNASIAIPVADWFSVGMRYSLRANITDFAVNTVCVDGTPCLRSQEYLQNAVFLTMKFTY